jgi:hypothetical protein
MERFVFIAAVTFAIIFGVVALVGGGHLNVGRGAFNIEFDGDGFRQDPVVETAPGRMEAQAFVGDELRLKHAAARVTITPEDRQDFLIEIDNPGHAPMPEVTTADGHVIIDGRLAGRIDNCLSDGGVDLRGYGDVAGADLPRINIRAPRRLVVSLGEGSSTEIGATEALELDFSGCGTATLADVAGALELDVAGSGQVRAGAARSLSADVAGSGDIVVGAITEGAEIDIAGSGTVTIANLAGPLSSDGAGSGDVIVQGGAITTAKIDLAGSGQVNIAASVQRLEVSILGSGGVDVAGDVGDIEADIAGSGSVTARTVTGAVTKDVLGSGDVRVSGERLPQNAP